MRRHHYKTLKLHTIFNVVISTIFIIVILINRDLTLVAATLFLLTYVIGNGVIHNNKNELSRDTIVEYIILSIIAAIVLINAVLR